jgi:hypothetical protein
MKTHNWDLWIDFQRTDENGLTHGNIRNMSPEFEIVVGDVIVVGNEDAESGVAEVVEVGERGVVLVKVLPGSVTENRSLLRRSTGTSK